MGDIKTVLDFLDPEQADYLRKRAEERHSTIEEELGRVIDLAIALDAPDAVQVTYNPRTGVVCRVPRNPASLMDFAGMISDPDGAGRNIHDLLYGEEADH